MLSGESTLHDTYLVRTLRPLFDLAAERGLDQRRLLEIAGVAAGDLSDLDSRAPASCMIDAYRWVAERLGDSDFGLAIGAGYRARNLGLVGHVMRHSSNLRHAFERLVRYRRWVIETLEVELVTSRSTLELIETPDIRLGSMRHVCDDYLGSALAIARELTGRELVPLSVSFYYPKPTSIDAHERHFRCPLTFGAGRGRLVFSAVDADRAVIGADSELLVYLDRHAEDVMAGLGTAGSFSERVRRFLWAKISAGTQPTLESAARELAVSERTLQRRLRAEEATFGGLVEGFRSRLARALLHDKSLAIYEVAYLLGYSEPSAFNRAFRRWTGSSPRQFRARSAAAR